MCVGGCVCGGGGVCSEKQRVAKEKVGSVVNGEGKKNPILYTEY